MKPPSLELAQRAAALVAAAPAGMTSQDVAAAAGIARDTAVRWLWCAVQFGLLEFVKGGPDSRWCVAATRDAAAAAIAAKRVQIKRARLMRQMQARQAKLQADPELAERRRQQALDAAIAGVLRVKQTIVPAHACGPLPKLGPASIFELGSAR